MKNNKTFIKKAAKRQKESNALSRIFIGATVIGGGFLAHSCFQEMAVPQKYPTASVIFNWYGIHYVGQNISPRKSVRMALDQCNKESPRFFSECKVYAKTPNDKKSCLSFGGFRNAYTDRTHIFVLEQETRPVGENPAQKECKTSLSINGSYPNDCNNNHLFKTICNYE